MRQLCGTHPRYYPDLARSCQRLGDEEGASRIYNGLIDIHHDAAGNIAEARGEEVTRLLIPAQPTATRFGELAKKLDLYVKARRLGMTPPVKAILAVRPEWVCNWALLEYWREQHADAVTILTDPAAAAEAEETYGECTLDLDYFRLPDGRALHVSIAKMTIWNLWEEAGGGPLLKLRDDHHQRGAAWMRARGVPEDAWFAALHVREAGYHDESGWAYNQHRNSRLEDYVPAIEAITQRGGWVVRIGDPSMTPLPVMENVIDYAVAEERAPELDLYFCAAARFMVAVVSGGMAVASVFGTPVLGVDAFPPGSYPYSGRDFYIHKRRRRRDTEEFLDAAEMLEPPRRLMQSPRFFHDQGLDVVANTAEDILDAVVEMMARLDGTFEMTEQDRADVDRYREMTDYPNIPPPPAPATSFLRRYRDLIE